MRYDFWILNLCEPYPVEYLEAEVAVKAKNAKRLARKNRSRRNIFILICFLVAFGATVIWCLVAPEASPTCGSRFALAIFIGFVMGELLFRLLNKSHPQCEAKCPVCDYSWEIKEGRSVPLAEQMGTWDRCPGCGLLMGDEIIDLSIRRNEDKSNTL